MHSRNLPAALLLTGIFLLAAPARAVIYTATLLHPAAYTGSHANGISGAIQVGDSDDADFGPPLPHALLWSGSAASVVDLHPAGFASSYAYDTTATHQVGVAGTHAMMWTGTAASAIDLHPAGFVESAAFGVSGTRQVGWGRTAGSDHALLWTGTAASVVDLHGSGFLATYAAAVSGTRQAGVGLTASLNNHALMWTGTAASRVDLHPAGFNDSAARGIFGTSVVGYGFTAGTNVEQHALLWHGSAASVVDLHPTDFVTTEATAISAAGQVGWGFGVPTDGKTHALLWSGAAEGFIDLHPFVSHLGELADKSYAVDIDDHGKIVGYVENADGVPRAVLWTPVSDAGVDGDYNDDGTVNAADYVMWRKGINPLNNEVATIGANTPGDYDEWVRQFGAAGSGAAGVAIPEPRSCAIMACGIALSSVTRWRRRALLS